MKKTPILLLLGSLLSLLLACGGGGGSDSGSSSSGSSSSGTGSSSGSFTFTPGIPIGEPTFTNPLLPNGADPWLEYYEGNYYLLTTTWTSQLVMRKSPTLAGLSSAKPFYVWSDDRSDRCCNFWAFEMHQLDGPNGLRWYIMYTAGHAPNLDGQKLRVLESSGTNPMGPYSDKGTPLPNRWNIDGTYLEENGNLYLLWSEWVGPNQSTWIAEMSDPWTVVPGTDEVIATPTINWELQGGRVNEGPEVLKHNGTTYVSFSASSCNTQFYKLGLLTLTGTDPLDPVSWTKSPDPVFESANGVFGPGHNGFFQSPDGTEDWLVYHGNNLSSEGCGDSRYTRAQRITYDTNDEPVFGEPASVDTVLDVPSGEMGPITADVQGVSYHIVNREHNALDLCLGVAGDSTADDANVSLQACADVGSAWVLDATTDDYYRLVNKNSGKVLDVDCATSDGANVQQTAWMNTNCQQWQIVTTEDGWLRFINRVSDKVLDIEACGSTVDANVQQFASSDNNCQQWRVEPIDQVAIANVNSGKVINVASCDVADGTNINQDEYLGQACQKWTFEHTDSGYYYIHPQNTPGSCMIVESNSTTIGGNLVQHQCVGDNSEFRIEPLPDGTVRFVARDSAHVADVDACGIGFGTNLGIWDWLDNDCQKFNLLPVL